MNKGYIQALIADVILSVEETRTSVASGLSKREKNYNYYVTFYCMHCTTVQYMQDYTPPFSHQVLNS